MEGGTHRSASSHIAASLNAECAVLKMEPTRVLEAVLEGVD